MANVAYDDTWDALGFDYRKVVATLDGRTCKDCARLDGNVYHKDDPKRPKFPRHYNSRTVDIGCDKDGNVAGLRPFVMDERKVKDIPKDERQDLIGQLDANTSFKKFFDQTDEFFQKEWLGPARYKLYKEGKYSIDKFVDPQGAMYTLDELKVLDAKTFKELGL